MTPFPPLKAFLHAINSIVRYWPQGVRIALPWLVVLAVLQLFIPPPFKSAIPGEPPDMSALFLSLVPFFIANSSIAVNWNRFILRDEMPTTARTFRFDAPVWKYLLRFIAVVFLASIGATIILIALMLFLPQQVLLPVTFFITISALMLFSISLPAAALERKDFGIMDGLKAAQGNIMPVVGFALLNYLAILLCYVVVTLIAFALRNVASPLGPILFLILTLPASLFGMLLSTSAVTSLYGFFAEKRNF
jgi:hypothetical protein